MFNINNYCSLFSNFPARQSRMCQSLIFFARCDFVITIRCKSLTEVNREACLKHKYSLSLCQFRSLAVRPLWRILYPCFLYMKLTRDKTRILKIIMSCVRARDPARGARE